MNTLTRQDCELRPDQAWLRTNRAIKGKDGLDSKIRWTFVRFCPGEWMSQDGMS
jgi:hypothetical protein